MSSTKKYRVLHRIQHLELTNLSIIVVKEVEGGGVEELEDLLVPRRVLHQVHQGGVRWHTPDQVWQGYFVNTAIGILLAEQNINKVVKLTEATMTPTWPVLQEDFQSGQVR